MKSFRLILGITLIGLLFALSGCPSPDPAAASSKDQQIAKLTKGWTCTAATLNGSPITFSAPNASYTYVGNFKITITKGGTGATSLLYTTTGRPTGTAVTPWKDSGTFEFGTDVVTTLTRDDGIVISYSVSDAGDQLQMSFTTGSTFTGYNGRVGNVQGNWVFTFAKQ